MAVATPQKRFPNIRQCPYCDDGIGTVQRTERITSVRKVRHYKCGSCLRYWQAPITIAYVPLPAEDKPKPTCAASPSGHVYFIGSSSGFVKIGFSFHPEARLRQLQTAHVETLTLLGSVVATEDTESTLHERFSHLRVRGEWFRLGQEIQAFIDDLPNIAVPRCETPQQQLPNESYREFLPLIREMWICGMPIAEIAQELSHLRMLREKSSGGGS